MRWTGVALGDPWADPATIPELQEIIRRRLLSKVRIYELRCGQSDRLLQVLKVNGRPLALAYSMLRVGGGSTTRNGHRGAGQAMWMDLPNDTYIAARRPLDPQMWEVSFLRISAQCAHERLSIPADWVLRELRQGITKRIIDNAARLEMRTRPRGR